MGQESAFVFSGQQFNVLRKRAFYVINNMRLKFIWGLVNFFCFVFVSFMDCKFEGF